MLSKGHAAPIQYAALAEHGYFPARTYRACARSARTFRATRHAPDQRRRGLDRLARPGPLDVGRQCLALRLDGLADTAHVFTLMSDGDCQEGQSWEARVGSALRIQNLTAIVDYNHLQTDGTTEEVMDTGDVRAKFEAFGWEPSRSTATTWTPSSRRWSAAAPRPAGRDRLPDQEGPRRLLHGGPLGFHGKPPDAEQAEKAGRARRDAEAQTEALNGAGS